MRPEDLEEGGLVRLKSGGPTMTVRGQVGTLPYAQCVWFDKRRVVQSVAFKISALVAVEPQGEIER